MYLNLSFNPNGLRPHHLHHLNVFVLSSIRLMTLDVHTAEVYASNQVRSKLTYLSGVGATGLPTRRPLLFLLLS